MLQIQWFGCFCCFCWPNVLIFHYWCCWCFLFLPDTEIEYLQKVPGCHPSGAEWHLLIYFLHGGEQPTSETEKDDIGTHIEVSGSSCIASLSYSASASCGNWCNFNQYHVLKHLKQRGRQKKKAFIWVYIFQTFWSVELIWERHSSGERVW